MKDITNNISVLENQGSVSWGSYTYGLL